MWAWWSRERRSSICGAARVRAPSPMGFFTSGRSVHERRFDMTTAKAVLITLACVLLWGASGTPAKAHHLTSVDEFEDCVLAALGQLEACLAEAQAVADAATCRAEYLAAHAQCVSHCGVHGCMLPAE